MKKQRGYWVKGMEEREGTKDGRMLCVAKCDLSWDVLHLQYDLWSYKEMFVLSASQSTAELWSQGGASWTELTQVHRKCAAGGERRAGPYAALHGALAPPWLFQVIRDLPPPWAPSSPAGVLCFHTFLHRFTSLPLLQMCIREPHIPTNLIPGSFF